MSYLMNFAHFHPLCRCDGAARLGVQRTIDVLNEFKVMLHKKLFK